VGSLFDSSRKLPVQDLVSLYYGYHNTVVLIFFRFYLNNVDQSNVLKFLSTIFKFSMKRVHIYKNKLINVDENFYLFQGRHFCKVDFLDFIRIFPVLPDDIFDKQKMRRGTSRDNTIPYEKVPRKGSSIWGLGNLLGFSGNPIETLHNWAHLQSDAVSTNFRGIFT
jgi:hypothetical protein